MSNYILLYLLFALTTALTAYYEIIGPVVRNVIDLEPENNISESANLARFTFTIICFALAPALFPICLVPSWGERFRIAMTNSVLEGRKIYY